MQYRDAILVDGKQRTSVRNIYAAGDVAALRNPHTGTYETRAQWYAAVAQGRIAGAMMVGHDELARQPLGVPWHATQLGELSMLTVGEPLNEDSQVMILTDTSQAGYRRLTIVDDRLVGYLSLGTTQPDSLAIKHIIDEGHSIRDVTNALLKGNLDVRRYLSQQKSRAVKKWITGQLLAPGSELNGTAQTRGLSDTDRVAPVVTSSQANALPVKTPAEHAIRPLEELPPPISARQDPFKEQRVIYEEEPSPFTGNLPVVFGQKRDPSASLFLEEDVQNIPKEAEPFSEEIGPFSGNLPAISDHVIKSRRQSIESRGKGRGGSVEIETKLWAYIESRAQESGETADIMLSRHRK